MRTPSDPLTGQDCARCAQIGGDMWFPEMGGSTKQVKAICATCPVRQQCLDYALSLPADEDKDGVFGGLSVRERQSIRRAAREAAA